MSEEAPKKLTNKQQVFIDEYLKCFNATAAAKAAGYSEKSARQTGCDLLADPNISVQIQARLAEIHMSADEALKLQADIARADLGVFFKVADEWMFNPLPEYEILDEREVIDDTQEPPVKRISYRVRHVVLDTDKIVDPRYSYLMQKFSNTRKNGLSIELYDKQTAIRDVLKTHGKFVERHDLTTGGEKLNIATLKPSEIAERVAALLKQKETHADGG